MSELPTNQIICGDYLEVMRDLPDGCVHCIITSPPYWGQRDYGTDGQIGLEKTFEEHIDKLVEGFREMRRILRDDGVLWVNYGDKYNTQSGNYYEGVGIDRPCMKETKRKRNNADRNLGNGNLIGLAWRLALALQADGWILRSDVIWAKAVSFNEKYSGSTMPESVSGSRWERCRVKVKGSKVYREGMKDDGYCSESYGNGNRQAQWQPCPGCAKCRDNDGYVLRRGSWRPTRAHEYVFQFVKKIPYYADMEAVREETSGNRHDLNDNPRAVEGHPGYDCKTSGDISGRNIRDVWTISTQPYTDYSRTYRLVRGGPDDTCDGRMHIVSPNCQLHGGLFDLHAMLDGDAHEAYGLSHILRSDVYLSQVQPADFVPTVPLDIYYCGEHSWGYLLQKCFPSATDRNSKNHKTGLALLTDPSCTPSAQRLSRIVRRLVSHGLSEQGKSIYESKTWPDDLDARLLGQMFFRIVDKSSFQKLLKEHKCQCGLYHIVAEKTSHYATFPTTLVEPMIKVSTSQKGVCPECGAQWARVIDSKQIKRERPNDRTNRHNQGGMNSCGNTVARTETTTLGWRPTCANTCSNRGTLGPYDPVPAVVYDPFAGSGTVAAVAARLGRNYMGSEISAEYRKQAEARIAESETAIPRDEAQYQLSLW